MSPRALLACVLLAAVVSVFFWHTIAIYPFRLLVTLMHESGHALMALLVGGEVVSVTISPGEGGLTLSRIEPTFVKRLLVSSGGYLGSSFAGAALLAAAGRMRTGRVLLWGLVGWMALVAIVWVPLLPPELDGGAAKASGFARSDGLFTLAFILGLGVTLGLLAAKAPVHVRRLAVVWIATLACLASLEDLKSLLGYGLAAGSGGSDAHALAELTHLPAAFWAGVWMLMSLFAMFVGVRSILRRSSRSRVPALRTASSH